MKSLICFALAFVSSIAVASATVSNVKARQRYPWNGKVDIDCTLSGEAGQSYDLKVSVRDKIGGTNLNVSAVYVEGGSVTNNPVAATSGVCRLVWNADKDLPNGFCSERVSISVTVTDNTKKFMVVDLQTGAITYQAAAPEGGWDVDEYKGTKMAFVRIEPGTFTQYSAEGKPGREVSITKPYYMGILPVTHKQLRTLSGETFYGVSFEDSYGYFYASLKNVRYAVYSDMCYRGNPLGISFANNDPTSVGIMDSYQKFYWPLRGYCVSSGSPLSILRERTQNEKFDLPTEAQATFARSEVIWPTDIYTLCLDVWRSSLGTCTVKDPLGDLPLLPDYSANFSMHVYATCIGKTERRSTNDRSPCARFCLYEVE